METEEAQIQRAEDQDLRARIKKALEGDGHELFKLTHEILQRKGNFTIEDFESALENVLRETSENVADGELEERLRQVSERARVLYMAMFVASLRAAAEND